MLNSVQDMAHIVKSLGADPCQPTVSVSSDGAARMWVNDTHTTTIFSERGMFSTSFNIKTNVIR